MKLARCLLEDGSTHLGAVHETQFVSFTRALTLVPDQTLFADASSVDRYLEHLPGSHEQAKKLYEFAQSSSECVFDTAQLKFLPPLEAVPALYDFGLSPRHLKNSAITLLRHQWGAWAAWVGKILLPDLSKSESIKTNMRYYKCNHLEIIGDGDEMGWPTYTSYLDVEPELGIVTGTPEQPIAGYLIYNDVSARDVQFYEMMGTGPARSKDFARGQGIGPYLVTPDEIIDPLKLGVTVQVGARMTWKGTTAEYVAHPSEVVDFLSEVFTPPPGTVIGMGTAPDCTGLDHDQWLEPGEEIAITIEGLGTLHQKAPAQPLIKQPSNWTKRGWQ